MDTEDTPKSENVYFTLALRLLANRRGLDAKALASAGGVDRRQINYILKGKRGAGKPTAARIAETLQTEYAEMLRLGRLLHEGMPEAEALAYWENAGKTLAQGSVAALLRSYFESVIQWQCEETAGDVTAGVNFTSEFERRFPEYREWRERKQIIKNPETGEAGLETGLIGKP